MLSLRKFFIASHLSESPLNKPSTTVNSPASPSASCDPIARDWLSNGEYARALERLEAMIAPLPDDVHNTGIALWGLERLEEALEYLHRARALGAPLAVVDIAALESLRGDGERAADRLARLNLETLTPLGQVRALYTHAEILRHNEALSASAARFHEAWYACEIAGDANRREPIALSLALTLHEMGDAGRAEGWFNRAERFAAPPRLDLVRLERALTAAQRGVVLPGLTLLKTLEAVTLSPYRRALADVLEGWCHAISDPDRAIAALERAAASSAATGTRELEIPARLRLSAVRLSLGDTLQARADVARIERLPMNRVRRNEVKVRRANVAHRRSAALGARGEIRPRDARASPRVRRGATGGRSGFDARLAANERPV
jgi:tetratricopeptide (TPR) repeat protein